ncbi:MAG TPA: hypothetical protein VF729_06515 [Solirubrobacterales bacterium]
MKRLIATLTLALALALPASSQATYPAQGNFGIHGFDNVFSDEDGTIATQAGSHPFAATFKLLANLDGEGGPEGRFKDLHVTVPRGFIGDPSAYPRCSTADFLSIDFEGSGVNLCPLDTTVGISGTAASTPDQWFSAPVFNLVPPPGVLLRIGFRALVPNIVVDIRLSTEPPYVPVATSANTPQISPLFANKTQLWGDPSDPAHDDVRGPCGSRLEVGLPADDLEAFEFKGTGKTCPVSPRPAPFLTLPTYCAGALTSSYETRSWEGDVDTGSVVLHDAGGNPQPFTGCGKLAFEPQVRARASSESAETGSGFEFGVSFADEGLKSIEGLAQSHAKKAVVTLPEGMTINPSVGEGLEVCTPAQIDRETLHSEPGAGCPNGSKLGTLRVNTPLLEESIEGSVFLAQQDDPRTPAPGAENPFDSLIALYLVLRNPNLGILVKLDLKVEPDPETGQLRATLDDSPQLPFSSFEFRFKEGARAPLITPPTCGTHTTEAKFYPWSDPGTPTTVTSSFEITSGVGGGPCPAGGVPPFRPHFQAGSLNNNAGSNTDFSMRLVRFDGEQNMTKFSSVLPPGVIGSLVGVDKCPDAALALAKSKTGRDEIASPSCPANSRIGRTLAGAGVGGALTYVPGQIYLAGPYKGAPLSVIAITPAVAGPFDAGTVAVRLGLTLNSKTAEVEVDGSASDPIPHILNGIILKTRELRVYVDRPSFIRNPTSCEESSVKAQLFGSFLDIPSPLDDVPVDLSTRYQAANCLNLGFKPKLALKLIGGTGRGGHPGLKATYRPRPGDANVEGLVVRLPRSAFLDQAHIRTICTRVQFAADQCPKGAQYGFIEAHTPLLEEPLTGPVWLRSSDHKLPDLVFDLHGIVDIEVAARIDSAKGGIRSTLTDLPDAPLSKVVLRMQGQRKGLIVNSRDLCLRPSRAQVRFAGQNGKVHKAGSVMAAQCAKGKRKR